jgi:hypothetical protein
VALQKQNKHAFLFFLGARTVALFAGEGMVSGAPYLTASTVSCDLKQAAKIT